MYSYIPLILLVLWEAVGVAFDQLVLSPPSSGNLGGGVAGTACPDWACKMYVLCQCLSARRMYYVTITMYVYRDGLQLEVITYKRRHVNSSLVFFLSVETFYVFHPVALRTLLIKVVFVVACGLTHLLFLCWFPLHSTSLSYPTLAGLTYQSHWPCLRQSQ